MSSATQLCGVGREAAGWEAELVVEHHGRGERGEAGAQADAKVGQGAGAVALEREDVLAGLKDRLDSLADRRQVRPAALLVLAAGAHDRRLELGELGLEVLAAEVLIADQDQRLTGLALAAGDQLPADELLVDLRRGQSERSWGAVGGEPGVQAKPEEVAAVAGAVAVVGGVGERVGEAGLPAALDRFARAGALHRGGVNQQQIVEESGALAREVRDQRLDLAGEPDATLVQRVPRRDRREQMSKPLAGDRDEPIVGRD